MEKFRCQFCGASKFNFFIPGKLICTSCNTEYMPHGDGMSWKPKGEGQWEAI